MSEQNNEPNNEPERVQIQGASNSIRNLFIGLIVCGVLLIAIFGVMTVRNAPPAVTPTTTFAPDVPGVTPVEPPKALTDFTLPSDTGDPLSLSALEGKYTMLFFGYTHCPDYCPLTLAEWKGIKTELGDDAATVNFVFISVDGQRDTPEVMQRYLSRFDESFIGLSGDEATLTEIGPDYGLYYSLNTDEGENYSVDHTTVTYLIDPQGRMIDLFSFDAEPDVIVKTIQKAMAGGA